MNIDNINKDLIYKIETEDKNNKKNKHRNKFMASASETLRKIVLEKLNNKIGEC
ncbi:MAG TPA: hypothetical protein VF828_04975 [Patescibacteria group bacterium]